MNIIHALVLGIVEGLTEFLPISSTAHMIIAAKLLGIPQTDFQKFFEVFIQSGAILAVLFLYASYALKSKKTMLFVLMSFVPTAAIGFVLYKVIKAYFFNSTLLIAAAFITVGVVFLIVERMVRQGKLKLSKSLPSLTWKTAVIIGLAQAVAVVPGISRSGIVLVSMMMLGYKREDAALYSFLLAVPTIFAASGYDLFKMRHELLSYTSYIPLLIIGFAAAFFSAYLVMRWFIAYLRRNSLSNFAWYRIGAGLLLAFFFR